MDSDKLEHGMCREGSDNCENLSLVMKALESVASGGNPETVYRRLCFSLSGCRVVFPARERPLLREMISRMLAEGMGVGQIVEKVGCSRQYVYEIRDVSTGIAVPVDKIRV